MTDIKCCIPIHPPQARGIASTDFIWRNRNTLNVGFMGGDPRLHDLVMAIIAEFPRVCNMRLEQVGDVPNADIRVSFIKNIGSWSYVGSGANHIPKDQATMNFGWLRPDMEPDSKTATAVVLHEFGHALGLRHEHLHPEGAIPWNRDAVYEWFAKIGRSREDVDRTYFNTLLPIQSQFSEFDPESVMIYPIEQEWTVGDFAVPWRTRLSDGDKAFLGELYPYSNHVWLPSIHR